MRLSYTVAIGATLLFLLSSNLSAKGSPPSFDLHKTKECETKLRSLGVKFKIKKKIDGPGQCGAPRPLNILKLKKNMLITSDVDVLLRCEIALALARWVSDVVVPSAQLHLEANPSKINISTSYKCRKRNSNARAKLSEHAFANGVDLMGISFDKIKPMKIQARNGDSDSVRAFQAAIRGGACAYFTTVIGPMTNKAHADHLHLDLAERSNGFRLCE